MKALVVEDDLTAQKVIRLFLEKSGYEPHVAIDGASGMAAALAPNAPSLIILDWTLPDIDGLAWLKKLRAAACKVRPYVIFLTAKKEKAELASALDVGADDFVSKPFNVLELQARLRVARRTLDYQRELQRQAEAGETLGQRTHLVDEIAKKQHKGEPAPVVVKSAKEPRGPADFSNGEIRFLLSATLMEMRLALEAANPTAGDDFAHLRATEYCGWGGLLLPKQSLWLDIMLKTESSSLACLFEKAVARAGNSDVEHRYFFAELARAVAMGFMRTLERRECSVLHPLMSRALKVETHTAVPHLPPDSRCYDLKIEDQPVRMIVAVNPCPMQVLASHGLRELDVLAEQFPAREISEIPMFREGVVLTPRFIEKLVYQAEASQVGEGVKIRRPSSLAQYFNYND